MGYSILELVLRRLRQANFTADVAFPGQKFPRITDTVAAVHIEKVDRANLTVTLEVNVICPAAMGGTACEVEALRATEVLRWSGAVCVQNGCTYDGVAQVYAVQVLATYTGVTEAEDCTVWQGFYCYVGDTLRRSALSVTAEYTEEVQREYAAGEALPVGTSPGRQGWEIVLEEQIPCGSAVAEDPEGAFTLELVTEGKTERFLGCRWTRVTREYSKAGLHRVSRGFAMSREVA